MRQPITHPALAAADLLDRSCGPLALADLIAERDGTIIPAAENGQPDHMPPMASIHFAGISGIGPHVAAAARDWRAQAERYLSSEIAT